MASTTIEKRIAKLEQTVRSLQDKLEYEAAVEGIRRGLESVERGEGEPVRTVFAKLRRKYTRNAAR
jgi:predicted transcriptional regulator